MAVAEGVGCNLELHEDVPLEDPGPGVDEKVVKWNLDLDFYL